MFCFVFSTKGSGLVTRFCTFSHNVHLFKDVSVFLGAGAGVRCGEQGNGLESHSAQRSEGASYMNKHIHLSPSGSLPGINNLNISVL